MTDLSVQITGTGACWPILPGQYAPSGLKTPYRLFLYTAVIKTDASAQHTPRHTHAHAHSYGAVARNIIFGSLLRLVINKKYIFQFVTLFMMSGSGTHRVCVCVCFVCKSYFLRNALPNLRITKYRCKVGTMLSVVVTEPCIVLRHCLCANEFVCYGIGTFSCDRSPASRHSLSRVSFFNSFSSLDLHEYFKVIKAPSFVTS